MPEMKQTRYGEPRMQRVKLITNINTKRILPMTQERPTVSAGSIIPKIFGISCNNGKTTNLSISGMVLQSPTGHMKKVLGSVMGKS